MGKTLLFSLMLLLAAPLSAQERGDWVLARWQGGDYWFPGVIERTVGNDITIIYDDGTRETLPLKLVRPYNWQVGTAIQCRWREGSQWYAGRIASIAADGATIEVHYADGDRERTRTAACRSQ